MDEEDIQRQALMIQRVRLIISQILHRMDRETLEDLMRFVLAHRLSGNSRSWYEFLEDTDGEFGHIVTSPDSRNSSTIHDFIMNIDLDGGLRVLARFLNPMRVEFDYFIRGRDPSYYPDPDWEPFEEQLLVSKLVGLTLTHPEFPFNYLVPPTAQDWLLIRAGNSLPRPRHLSVHADIIYLSTDLVGCDDGSLAAIRVCALRRIVQGDATLTNVILDSFVELDMDKHVIDYKTELTGLVAEDIEGEEAYSVAQVQEILRTSLSLDTVLVGHDLHLHLEALKMQHARVIDTSLLFRFQNLDYPLDEDQGAVGLLRRPTLDELVKGWLFNYDVHTGCQHAAFKLHKILRVVLNNTDLEDAGNLRIPGPGGYGIPN